MALRNRLWHQRLRRQAAERGWRITTRGWRTLLRPSYRLAGQTPGGVVWELSRFWRDGRLRVRWVAHTTSLPYGHIIIEAASAENEGKSGRVLVNFEPVTTGWPAGLHLRTTHQQLAQRIDRPAVVACLNRFPPPPHVGAFEKCQWDQKSLVIECRYEHGWDLLERLVDLGSELLTNNPP